MHNAYTCIYISRYMQVCVCACVRVCTYTRTHTHTHTHTHTGMEDNYTFVRQAAKEVLGGNTSFLKQVRRNPSLGLTGGPQDLTSDTDSIGSASSMASFSSEDEGGGAGRRGSSSQRRGTREGGAGGGRGEGSMTQRSIGVKGGKESKRELERARAVHEAGALRIAEEERLRDFQNIMTLQEQPAAAGGPTENASLLALRHEVPEASRVFVHTPHTHTHTHTHTHRCGKHRESLPFCRWSTSLIIVKRRESIPTFGEKRGC
jgi:hypothetical protein